MERNPVRIAVGTTSAQKINYLSEVLHALQIEAWLCHADVQSGVSAQPLTSDDTKQGSINRAKNALATFPNAEIGLGIEVGYLRNKDGRYEILCWASIINQQEDTFSCCSHTFLLPMFHQRILEENLPLGGYVDEYVKQTTDPVMKFLAEMIKGRKPFINMSTNLKDKFNKGLKPQEFIGTMSVNKDKFLDWYDQFSWHNGDDEEFFLSLKGREDVHCLILAADWCGDVIRNVPVVFRALEVTGISTEVLIMEENLDVMDRFLTMGGRAIPIVLFVNQNGSVLGQWGPRPQNVQEVMVQFKQGNPDRNAPDYADKIKEVYAEMLKQYGEGTDYQNVIIKELRELLSSI